MSVDIAWDSITAGPDGEVLAESIRSFIHDKFQQITLPRFINSVHVHSFEFGSVCPEIEIKEICDPLPDFYEDDEAEEPDIADPSSSGLNPSVTPPAPPGQSSSTVGELHNGVGALQNERHRTDSLEGSMSDNGSTLTNPREGLYRSAETAFGPFPRSGTPGIPGGTSNMNYFHFPMSGLSGAQTPLAAVAGGGPFTAHAWLHDQQSRHAGLVGLNQVPSQVQGHHQNASSVRTTTAQSISSPELGSPLQPSSPEAGSSVNFLSAEKVSDDLSSDHLAAHPPLSARDRVSPSDLQVVARVTYDGDVRMMLTAEILLDYPMPSFVNIPLKLCITGVTFDGVAILAYIKQKMHFCFLDPEDAETLVGTSVSDDLAGQQKPTSKKTTIGNLLQEIHVDTEIGRQESGKQVLKNVGKVERFVLEQVRRIFEEEFVFPSFWTFLI
ncbi:Mitochondrial distribution and morphology protein 12 [Neophaeococcomyces mojaviensis]|uniref:Mitochondrial distribution and morphology protein 12 n=1 Tax=Neophaeococcomyces mojaviensis TaxID=3383035 RepID=A0ACC3AG95_9EURO|nr:Mitochondrial distribution and morphology protein 12 [Knufia sp. JES_112]